MKMHQNKITKDSFTDEVQHSFFDANEPVHEKLMPASDFLYRLLMLAMEVSH